jgi:hypothetical protein
MAQLTSIHPDQPADQPNRPAPAAHPAPAVLLAPNADLVRIKYGAWLIVAAFLLLGIVFALAIWQFSAAADVTAVVGSVTTVVGTIIGAFFGVQIGSAGKEAAENGRAHAERAARLALGKLEPRAADDVVRML